MNAAPHTTSRAKANNMADEKKEKAWTRRPIPRHTWDKIKLQYEGGMIVKDILKFYGVGESTFHWRRKKENWSKPVVNPIHALKDAVKEPSKEKVEQALSVLERRPPQDVQAVEDGGGGTDLATQSNKRILGLLTLLGDRLKTLLISPDAVSEENKWRDRTRGLLDIATTLERIQKIERVALGLDDNKGPIAGHIVIIAPGKEPEEKWAKVDEVIVLPNVD